MEGEGKEEREEEGKREVEKTRENGIAVMGGAQRQRTRKDNFDCGSHYGSSNKSGIRNISRNPQE